MKKTILQLAKHPLISGSAIIFLGTNLGNFFSLLFNFFMGRNLSNADFGILTSLNSFIVLFLLASAALSPIVVNFAGKYFAKGELDLVHGLYNKIAKYFFSICTGLLVIFLILSPYFSQFLHMSDIGLVVLTGIITYIGVITILNISFIQAKLAFLFLSLITVIAATIKLLLGVLFFVIGTQVGGAVWAIFFSALILFVMSFYPLRFVFKRGSKPSPVPTRELLSYGVPTALTILGLTAFISTDIFLVKHFFTADMAGIYAKLELVAKIIYFFTSPIAGVMFPLIIQKRSNNEAYIPTFLLGIILVAIPSLVLTISYFVLPQFILGSIFPGSSVASYGIVLGLFGSMMLLYSLVAYLAYFYLSLNKTKITYPICLFAIMQGVLIWSFHSSFIEVISISLILMFVLVTGLLLYFPYATKK